MSNPWAYHLHIYSSNEGRDRDEDYYEEDLWLVMHRLTNYLSPRTEKIYHPWHSMKYLKTEAGRVMVGFTITRVYTEGYKIRASEVDWDGQEDGSHDSKKSQNVDHDTKIYVLYYDIDGWGNAMQYETSLSKIQEFIIKEWNSRCGDDDHLELAKDASIADMREHFEKHDVGAWFNLVEIEKDASGKLLVNTIFHGSLR